MTTRDDTLLDAVRKILSRLLRLVASSPEPARSSVTWPDPNAETGFRGSGR